MSSEADSSVVTCEEVERRAETMAAMRTEYAHHCRKLWEYFEPQLYPLQEKHYSNHIAQLYLEREIAWNSLRWTAMEAKGLRIGVDYHEEKELSAELKILTEELSATHQSAIKALRSVTREETRILRQYEQPPPIILETLSLVYLLRGEMESFTWEDARIFLTDSYFFGFFLNKAESFDLNSVPDAMMDTLWKVIQRLDFEPGTVRLMSNPVGALAQWIHAIFQQAHARRYLIVPSNITADDLQRVIATKRREQQRLKEEIVETAHALTELRREYQERRKALQVQYDEVMEPIQDAFIDAHRLFTERLLRGLGQKTANI